MYVSLYLSILVYSNLSIYQSIYQSISTNIDLQGAEAKYGIIFKTFFSLISPIFEEKT